MTDDKAAAFAGTMAEFYDRYLVPLNFGRTVMRSRDGQDRF